MIIPTSEMKSVTVYVVEYWQYSCGGYWVASQWGDEGEVWINNKGPLSEQQVQMTLANLERNNKVPLNVQRVQNLPEGSKILNLRRASNGFE